MPLLAIQQLKTYYTSGPREVRAVDGVDLDVSKGEILAVIGETGSGKSTLGLSISRLLPESARVVGGKVFYEGLGDLLALPEAEMRRVRGRRIGMVFQNPRTHLNPVMKVGNQIAEGMITNYGTPKSKAMEESLGLLQRVKITSPETRMRQYPHQLSGGMQQRVLLAMALASQPDLLIADEPTSALDVITQEQIIDMLVETIRNRGMSMIFITHDIELALRFADRVCVMYAGTMFEVGPRADIFNESMNPYTLALIQSSPRPENKGKPLSSIPGAPPNILSLPPGCSFNPRCRYAQEICRTSRPLPASVGPNHLSMCHFAKTFRGP